MKLRTFYVLCFLCFSSELVAEEDRIWNGSRSLGSEELELYLNESNPRDKRALGLILSGLAQVFGYDVSPIQVASLPNPDPPTVIALAANETQQTSNASSTTASPRQRETIRFTGVLNFGNNASLLSQLQEYEQMFHGSSNETGSAMNSTSPTSTEPPVDIRHPLAPLLVNIPLPVMRQPPLPEIPPQDIKLSYPPTVPVQFVPVRGQPETANKQNQSSVKQTIESRPVQNGQEVKSSRAPGGVGSTGEPPWKKEYDERLAELERKQAEYAEKLRQQERYRNRAKDHDYDNEDEKWNRGKGDEDNRCADKEKDSYSQGYTSAEEDGSSERYQDRVKRPNESGEDEDDRDYEDQKPPKLQEDFSAGDNYTNVQFVEPLPITRDHEQQWPEQLRNSYGELLNSSELDDGFANFFNQFKDSSLYTSPGSQASKENPKEEDYPESKEDDDKSSEKREEVDLPARSKYEEYSLEDDEDAKRNGDERIVEEDARDKPGKLPDKFLPSGGNRSKLKEEVNYSSFMPLIVPARYVSASEEVKKAKSRLATVEKPSKIKAASRDNGKKVQGKESRGPKKENLKPKTSVLDRQLPKKLREGEQKDLQLWPAPFDFVLDGTIQPDVASGKLERRYVKPSFAARKDESRNGRTKETQKTERQTTSQSPGQRSRDPSGGDSYEKFKNDLKLERISSKQPAAPVNAENRTRAEIAAAKQPRRRVPQSAETTDHWDRFKYTTSDNYLVVKGPNVEMAKSNVRPTQEQTPNPFPKRFDGLKRSTEKIEPVLESYFTERPTMDDSKMADVSPNAQGFQVVMPEFVPPMFQRPPPGYFHFTAMNYQPAEKIDTERAIGIVASRQHESFARFASEPENEGEKVPDGSYSTGTHNADVLGQKNVELNRPMDYVDYVRML